MFQKIRVSMSFPIVQNVFSMGKWGKMGGDTMSFPIVQGFFMVYLVAHPT
jgi:hypothetical protein